MDNISKNLAGILLLILCLNFFVGFASADGIIIPRPIPDIQHIPPLSIKYHHVNISIDNQYAKIQIDQIFENNFGRDLEGTYIFPLPDDASISEFSMFADNEKLEGRILEKDKAREIYEGIVRQLRDPALLEYTERNTFTARVYPIPANGEKRIQLTYSEVVKCDNDICKYTYPLETEKFSSKPLKDVVISVKLSSKQAIKTIYSPSHKISVKRINDYEAEVSYEENNIKPDKDFILYWTVSEDDIGGNILTYKKAGEDGFFILMLSPKQEISKEEILPKDIVFVLDTSGSMSGNKIEQAKNALKFIVNNLNERDRFNIITFNTEIKKFDEGLIQVNFDNRKNAENFINRIDATGGTNIHDALLQGLSLFENKNSNSTKIIIFLTDGLPTVGITETNKILNDVKSANKKNVKIFTFGVGYDVNTHLLDKISGQNNGASEYVEPEENIEVKVSGFYSKINSPVLSDVKLDFDGINVYDVYPKEIPDLFKGSQLIVFGRYSSALDPRCAQKAKQNEVCSRIGYEFDLSERKCVIVKGAGCIDRLPFSNLEECQRTCEINSPKENITLKLTGKSLNKEKFYSYNLDFPTRKISNGNFWAQSEPKALIREENLKNEFIPKLWASRKIGYLLDEIRLNGENKEVIDEVINLSLRYGIMTPYTSFLVDMDRDMSRPAVREEARDMFNTIAMKSFSQTTGAGAVKTAQSMQEMQKSGISQDGSERVKSIGVKTFYYRDGIWIDNDYVEAAKIKDLNYGSEEYFKLLNENPEFGKYLSLGKSVKFCLEGRCFSIGEKEEMGIPTSTTIFSFPESIRIRDDMALVQTIAIIGLIILISAVILFIGRHR